jgi:hypothetical protein
MVPVLQESRTIPGDDAAKGVASRVVLEVGFGFDDASCRLLGARKYFAE